jgi:hypothetical protein
VGYDEVENRTPLDHELQLSEDQRHSLVEVLVSRVVAEIDIGKREMEKCPYRDERKALFGFLVAGKDEIVISDMGHVAEEIAQWFAWAVKARRRAGLVYQWIEYYNAVVEKLGSTE